MVGTGTKRLGSRASWYGGCYLVTARDLIVTAHKADRKAGTCGKAPSYYLDFAAFLVAGIDSMSLNPDSVVSVMKLTKTIWLS